MVSLRDESPAVPFGGIVGQEALKEGLLAVAAHPDLDGLLIRGEKGTAKSTAVRGLADLLPEQQAVADCPYGCPPADPASQCTECRQRTDLPTTTRPVPLVTLPLGATRERVVGSLSVADALDGDPEFDPGLLARANRGILYVDEVNLLDDHLVDVLLDAAASGRNRVERDGVSVTHPANFTLVGTMNPEEGDLRPQLRDRFALSVTVEGSDDLDERLAVLNQVLEDGPGENTDERSGNGHTSRTQEDIEASTAAARDRLRTARELLDEVTLPTKLKTEIVELCRDAGVDGHRADIAMARTARTLAALADRPTATESDVRRAAEFALAHRMRSDPFEDAADADTVIDDHFEDDPPEEQDSEPGDGTDQQANSDESGTDQQGDGGSSGEADQPSSESGEGGSEPEAPENGSGDGPQPEADPDGTDPSERGPTPRTTGADQRTGDHEGATGDDPSDRTNDEAEDGDESGSPDGDGGERQPAAPIVPGSRRAPESEPAAAPSIELPSADGEADGGTRAQSRSVDAEGARIRTDRTDANGSVDPAASLRAAAARGADAVGERDLRASVRSSSGSALVVVSIDASASMRGPMRAAKGAVLDLLRDAYEQRDAVAVVAFAGTEAEVVLPPTDSVSMAARHLKELPTADRTPLPDGIETTASVIERADPEASVAVLVTDGRATAGTDSPTADSRAAADRLGAVADRVLVVDAGDRDRSLIGTIAEASAAQVVPLSGLTPDRLDSAVGNARK